LSVCGSLYYSLTCHSSWNMPAWVHYLLVGVLPCPHPAFTSMEHVGRLHCSVTTTWCWICSYGCLCRHALVLGSPGFVLRLPSAACLTCLACTITTCCTLPCPRPYMQYCTHLLPAYHVTANHLAACYLTCGSRTYVRNMRFLFTTYGLAPAIHRYRIAYILDWVRCTLGCVSPCQLTFFLPASVQRVPSALLGLVTGFL